MTRSRLKYTACAACGFRDGSREHSIAQLAMDEALDRWPSALPVVMEAQGYSGDMRKWEKQLRKLREHEEDRAYRAVKAATLAKINADRNAYGVAVGFVGTIWLLLNLASILWPLIRYFFNRRYEGHDNEIQQAVGAA